MVHCGLMSWFVVVRSGLMSWFVVVRSGSWWFVVVCCGLMSWFMVVRSGLMSWFMVVHSGSMKSRLLPGVVSVAGGSRWWECTVLEIFAWLPALKMG